MHNIIGISSLIVFVGFAVACNKEGASGGQSAAATAGWGKAAEVVSEWKEAGLATGEFAKVDPAAFGGGECQSGKVAGVETTLCQHPSAEKAAAVRSQALKKVGDATSYALAQGELILVVADRTQSDPSGKEMNKIALNFQKR